MKQILFSILIILFVPGSILAQIQNATLLVDFSASPSSGLAPLNNVDLTASVSGTAQGVITYRFDCTGDGIWEHTANSASTSYTTYDLCNYLTQGIYNPISLVERGGLSSQGSMVVNVIESVPAPSSIGVTILAKNISIGQTSFADSVEVRPGDKIELQIQVNPNAGTAYNVTLKNTLPPQLTYLGNLKIQDIDNTGSIFSGLSLGDITAGQPRFITFKVQVASESSFNFGTNDVINTVILTGTNASGSDAITFKVQRSEVLGTSTAVSTGLFKPSIIALTATLAIGFLVSYILLLRFYVKNHVLPKAFQAKAEQDLEQVISRIEHRKEQLV